MHGAEAGDEAGGIPQPVLGIEHDGGEALACDCLGDDGAAHHAPAGKHRLAGAQPPGEGKGGHVQVPA